MKNFNMPSYLFSSIAVIIEHLFVSSHYFNYILVLEIIYSILDITLAGFGKPGKQKLIAIILNSLYFILFSPLALLNLWI
ncbi:hypothetical protein CN907_01335, partial [Bacillus anthracis]